jgi:hypothetical protein
MIEPSFGLIVMPVHAEAIDGPAVEPAMLRAMIEAT